MKKIDVDEITKYVDTIDGELWRVAEGFENYFVSNYGRVYSLYHSKLLKSFAGGEQGYMYVKLYADKKPTEIRLHKFIAMNFIPNPDHKGIIHHIDRNIKNNKADNLMWVTLQEHTEIHRGMKQEDNKNA